jgi:hypothetical protein
VLAGFIGGARARSACFKRDRAAAKGPIAHPPWLGKLFAISPVSAEAIVYLASSPEAGTTTGQYYYKCLRTVGAGTGRPICLLLWQRQRAIGRHEGKWCTAALTPSSGSHRVFIFSRTPISPASSSVKWMPACSRAFCILRMVEKFPFTVPSFCSIRRRVAKPMPALRESLSWLQPRSARAARI